jgi:hypothetical protein
MMSSTVEWHNPTRLADGIYLDERCGFRRSFRDYLQEFLGSVKTRSAAAAKSGGDRDGQAS